MGQSQGYLLSGSSTIPLSFLHHPDPHSAQVRFSGYSSNLIKIKSCQFRTKISSLRFWNNLFHDQNWFDSRYNRICAI